MTDKRAVAAGAVSREDLDEAVVAASSKRAALKVVAYMTGEQKRPDATDETRSDWETVVRLAHRTGASPQQIADASGTTPDAISEICGAREAASSR